MVAEEEILECQTTPLVEKDGQWEKQPGTGKKKGQVVATWQGYAFFHSGVFRHELGTCDAAGFSDSFKKADP